MTDLTYKVLGIFTSFIPVTKDGEDAFRVICKAQGDHTGKVLTTHLESTLKQLRNAGYTVRKAKPVSISDVDADALLKELGL